MDFKTFPSFGSKIAYAEPSWYQKRATCFYNESHVEFRNLCRQFVEKEIMPFVHEWDEAKTYPKELHAKCYEYGIYGAPFPVEYGGTPPVGGMDSFHAIIFNDELGRAACGGLQAALFSIGIGLPPILEHGSKELKDRVARDVITGQKIIALAITEPFAGSDVSRIRTTAVLKEDHFLLNGEKKFITSGCRADYFTVACQTQDSSGNKGISMILVESNLPGVTVRRIPTTGWWASNTAFIVFDDVKVSKKNLIGELNHGFLYIMLNFNKERFGMCAFALRYCRVCLEDSVSFARQRKTFGKRLIDHQVIRHKIVEMASRISASEAFLEALAAQMDAGTPDQITAGSFALCKTQLSRTLEYCARESAQVFGGNSFVRGGKGERIERINREVRVFVVGGGSYEVMNELAARQAKL